MVSAGIYYAKRKIFEYLPEQENYSLEYDIFPGLVNEQCYGVVGEGELIDIGVPERYRKANELFSRMSRHKDV